MKELSDEKRGLVVFAVVATLCLIGREALRPGGGFGPENTLGGHLTRTGSPSKLYPGSPGAPNDDSPGAALTPPDSSNLPGLPGMRTAASSREGGEGTGDSSYGAPGAPGAGAPPGGHGGAPAWQMGDSGGGGGASAGAPGPGGGKAPGGASAAAPGAPGNSGGPPAPGGGGGGGGGAHAASAAARAKAASAGLGAGANGGAPGGAPGMPGAGDTKAGGAGGAAAKLNGAAAAAKSGGGGGDAGGLAGAGAGGGGGGGGGLGGGAPDAKPKGSAGPPKDGAGGGAGGAAGGSAGGGAGSSNGRGTGGGGGGGTSDSDSDVTDALAGVPHPTAPNAIVSPTDDSYAEVPGGPQKVTPVVVKDASNNTVMIQIPNTKMAIDADGAGDAHLSDPTGKDKTALIYADGTSLNPQHIPYAVVPPDFLAAHPEVKKGDYMAVTYQGKTIYAVIGDVGPAGVVGECSIACARSLHIPASPTTGGVPTGVTYSAIPNSAGAAPPTTFRETQTLGAAGALKGGVAL